MAIDIIGGGIGGLTTAIALMQKGIKTRVFERAKRFQPIGAGIILANNAMQVYEKLGLRREIERLGHPITSMNITDKDLNPLSKIRLKSFEKHYGVKSIAIHRGILQQLLVGTLDPKTILLDKELGQIKRENGYKLEFLDGTAFEARALIGADGLHSMVRRILFNENKIRSTKQICWRGIANVDLPEHYKAELNEAWGVGNRFGFVQIGPGKTYWYALENWIHTNGSFQVKSPYFEEFHPLVSTLMEATPVDQIHTDFIYDLKPLKRWTKDGVCLLGDAAHATTPNLGQGACQAIEDAYVLAACLEKYRIDKAFKTYERLRVRKAHLVVNQSWKIGQFAHWENPLAVELRNLILKYTPAKLNHVLTNKIFELTEV